MTALQEHFHLANSRYFRGKLKRVKVKWKRDLHKGHLGVTYSQLGKVPKGTRKFYIEIDCKLRKMPSIAILTLIHEMVHVEQWDHVTDKTCHDRKFQRRMKQLSARGAFTGLW